MTAASWDENGTKDEDDEASTTYDVPRDRDVRTQNANEDPITRNEMEASARLLHHFSVSAWEHHQMEMETGSARGLAPRPSGRGETVTVTESEPSPCPEWTVIKQDPEESEAEPDEDEDMTDQLVDDD